MSLRKDTGEWRLLRFLNDLTYEFLDLSLPRSYRSRTALLRAFFGLDSKSKKFTESDWQRYKKLFSATLTRLKRKGYIVRQRTGNQFSWKMSQQGKKTIEDFQGDVLPEDGISRLFVFDIPESKRYYRDWIRIELVASGYALLQKSVWFGTRPLGESFLKELVGKDLFQYIHFFEVKDEGTLRNLVPEQ
ncbi:MAG: hypothetical protein CO102_00210 [Candidatus Brennerbacteria bacterium CG_4_9_14_3_um_filter_43_9]|uniref:Transcriptional repressor PaaX-like central Cas2-like domain-containing protein n=1 Tax=Candidatus Brennerbacteria bacterium CG_4_9_14_3_um_filter_43_9 TaxID=1974522 RepID=A0A2M8C3P6_9BACT|nr:MAG: hypothetical protein CO102_00210 [Candidatus Brennerbacteria bacterium CG_4_9_14_3_um_filter_43_9]